METSTLEQKTVRFSTFDQDRIKNRDPKFKKADLACIEAIAQAAINVELFTIPLYMTSMYSIYGLHQINSKDTNFYEGRWWPGAAPSYKPKDSSGKAFNLIFSVFIEEMLHLQLASNVASIIGFDPCFTSEALQNKQSGWTCYTGTTIPHILDFTDCKKGSGFENTVVKLQAMNSEQIKLFLTIEETAEKAKEILNNPIVTHPDGSTSKKYFETAPFDWFTDEMSEKDLPLFGTIGDMYLSFWDYLEIEYTNGEKLLDLLTKSEKIGVQRDEFNNHPDNKEYPGIDTTLTTDTLKIQLMNIINAITDQGEGKGVIPIICKRWNIPHLLKSVQNQFQPNPKALKALYEGYDDKGNLLDHESGQAYARITAKAFDHYEVFEKVQELIEEDDFMTWDTWHKDPKNKWTKELLNPENTPSNYTIPSAEEVANALNNLKSNNPEDNFKMLSLASVGTIKGITSQLDEYWKKDGKVTQFPSPAMYGSGDRLSICWAITGKTPDLATGLIPLENGQLYHACQGMNLMGEHDPNSDPDTRIFHSCKGSNDCKTQGGCGFVQSVSGGGNCSQSVAKENVKGGCGAPVIMSAPADNKCGTLGGCAVPISASQLFPEPKANQNNMQLFDFDSNLKPVSLPLEDAIQYEKGELVYDVAWKAYSEVLKCRGEKVPDTPPKASDMRLAFPPST